MTQYGQNELVLPVLDLLEQHPSGLTTTQLIELLSGRLQPTGHDAEVSNSRPGEPNFHQTVRNLTAPTRRSLIYRNGLVTYSGAGQPLMITSAGRRHLADARLAGSLPGFARGPNILGRGREPHRPGGAFGTPYRRVDESTTARVPQPFSVDPNVVDRGTRGHKRTQNFLADFLIGLGIEPQSPGPGDPDFDIGWRAGGTWFVAEVKSLTAANESRQLRLGLGQVLDYHDELARGTAEVQAVLMVERNPDNPRWAQICQRHGVILAWPEALAALFAIATA